MSDRDDNMNKRPPSNPSQENIIVLQAMYDSFRRGDVDAMLGFIGADVEWREPNNPINPAAGARHGHAGFLEWLRIGRQSEEILVLELRQFLTSENMVAVVGFARCRAKATGKSYETDFIHLITLKEGKIARFQEFFDTYAAAEAFRLDSSPSDEVHVR
jgi:uncharacterized protein